MIFTVLVVALSFLVVANCNPAPNNQEPCNDCCITEYSKWKLSEFREVPKNQCVSGYVVVEKRMKMVLTNHCDNQTNKTEERIAECAPEQSLRLAMLLDLGGSGQNTNSLKLNYGHTVEGDILGSGRSSRSTNVPWDDEDYDPRRHVQICRARGRRDKELSAKEMREKENHKQLHHTSQPEPEPLESDPIEFDIHEHSHRYRRTTQCEVQHVLFLLDTSGSVGHQDFRRVTKTLGNMVPLFCKSIEIAAMTFSNRHFREFCFNEFDNDCAGRYAARNAIKSIRYRGGSTFTAEAVQCAFDNFFTPTCGLPQDAECVSIVFFTDGMSNGNRDVCEVVERLKEQRKFESYSVGIGSSTNQAELRCLASDADKMNMFQFSSFNEFVKELSAIEYVFAETGFTCLNGPDSKPSNQYGVGSECSKFQQSLETDDRYYSGSMPN